MLQRAAGLQFTYDLINKLAVFDTYRVTVNGFLIDGDLFHLYIGPDGDYWQHSVPPEERRPNLPHYATAEAAARALLARHRQHATAFLAATEEWS